MVNRRSQFLGNSRQGLFALAFWFLAALPCFAADGTPGAAESVRMTFPAAQPTSITSEGTTFNFGNVVLAGDRLVLLDYSSKQGGKVSIASGDKAAMITLPRTGSEGAFRMFSAALPDGWPDISSLKITLLAGDCFLRELRVLGLSEKMGNTLERADGRPEYLINISGSGRRYTLAAVSDGDSSSVWRVQLNGRTLESGWLIFGKAGRRITPSTQAFYLNHGFNRITLRRVAGTSDLEKIQLEMLDNNSANNELLMGLHFAGPVDDDLKDLISGRGLGQKIFTTEVYASMNQDPEDSGFQDNMRSYITGYLKPLVDIGFIPIVRIDHIWGEVVPKFLPDGKIDEEAVSRYAGAFRKFAEIAAENGVPVRHFIVGNEMNLRGEAKGFEDGYLPEWYYAYVYDKVVREMQSLPGPVEVLVGGLSPGSLEAAPDHSAPDEGWFNQVYSRDVYGYLENLVVEIKKLDTPDVAFSLHAYADFNPSNNYSTSFMWTLRRQLGIINSSHEVVGKEGDARKVPGFSNAPVYITEWNRHTPQEHPTGRVYQETATSGFMLRVAEHIERWNTNQELWDTKSQKWLTYDPDGYLHNFHPIRTLSYFVFDSMGGPWGDYAIKDWKRLPGSATGEDDMFETYKSLITRGTPAGQSPASPQFKIPGK